MVVSLLASDISKNDATGREIARELYQILDRTKEASVQPVGKDDVAEVLRRRLFNAKSIRDREGFRPHVVAALKGIFAIDSQTEPDPNAP